MTHAVMNLYLLPSFSSTPCCTSDHTSAVSLWCHSSAFSEFHFVTIPNAVWGPFVLHVQGPRTMQHGDQRRGRGSITHPGESCLLLRNPASLILHQQQRVQQPQPHTHTHTHKHTHSHAMPTHPPTHLKHTAKHTLRHSRFHPPLHF